jgi:phage nucleotide-binding protein
MAVKKPAPIPREHFVNILLYSEPGDGKTTFAASGSDHPSMGPVLIISAEGGLLAVSDDPNVHHVKINSTEELEEVFWHLRKRDEGWESYKTVVLDTLTEIQTVNLAGITEAASKTQKAKDKGRTKDDIYLEDYGTSTAALKRLFRWFRDLPIHTVYCAWTKEKYRKDADPSIATPILVQPSLTGKLLESTCGYMDFVWLIRQNADGKRQVLWQRKAPYYAKTRSTQRIKAFLVSISGKDSPVFSLDLDESGRPVPSLGAFYDAFFAQDT